MRDIITKLEELNVEQEQLNEGLADMAHEAEKDHEVQMARSDCYKSAKYAVSIHKMLKDVSEMEGIDGWVASKLTKAADYLGSVKHYMEGQAMQDVELAVVPVAGDMTDAMTLPEESVEVAEGRLGFKDIAKFGSEKASRIDQEARRRGSADMEPGDADELRYRIAKEMGLISEQFDNTKRDFAPTRNDAIKAQGSAAVMVAKRDYKPPIEVKNIMNDKLKGIIKQKERFAKNISKSAGVDPQATNKMLAKQPTVGAGTNNPFDNMDEDISAMANSRDAVESTYGQIMQGKRGTQPDQSEVGDYIPKGMTPKQIMELIDMLEPQGYDKDFLLKDLADMMQEDEDVIGDIIGKLGKATKAGMKGGRDTIGDIIAKLPKDDEPKRAPGPRVSAVTKQKAANKMAMPTSKPSPKQRGLPRSLAQDTTTPLTQSKFSEWSKK